MTQGACRDRPAHRLRIDISKDQVVQGSVKILAALLAKMRVQGMSMRFGSLEIFTQPCPHFVIDGLFDDDFYHDVVDAIPEICGFDRHDPAATGALSILAFCRVRAP